MDGEETRRQKLTWTIFFFTRLCPRPRGKSNDKQMDTQSKAAQRQVGRHLGVDVEDVS